VSRRYDEPVEVRRRDDDPAEFLWRGRLYVVQAVLSRWVETGAWWQAGVPAVDQAVGQAVGRLPATQGSSALAVEPDSAALSLERELWRVEASRGRVHGSGVFDLCFDWASDSGAGWSLVRALD
jgi:uncharacterized protein DUF6504